MKTQAYVISAENYGPDRYETSEPMTRAQAAQVLMAMRAIRKGKGKRIFRECLPSGVCYTQGTITLRVQR